VSSEYGNAPSIYKKFGRLLDSLGQSLLCKETALRRKLTTFREQGFIVDYISYIKFGAYRINSVMFSDCYIYHLRL
jgi:hypothetical protein